MSNLVGWVFGGYHIPQGVCTCNFLYFGNSGANEYFVKTVFRLKPCQDCSGISPEYKGFNVQSKLFS